MNHSRAQVRCRAAVIPTLLVTLGFACAVTVSAQSFITPPTNCIGWWPGDGNANDIKGTNNGVLQNGTTATNAGKWGQAFKFDGGDDYVEMTGSQNLPITNVITVEAWVLPSSTNSCRSIASKLKNDKGWCFSICDGQLRAAINGGGYGGGPSGAAFFAFTTDAILSTSEWTHVAFSFDAGTQTTKFFVNGIEKGFYYYPVFATVPGFPLDQLPIIVGSAYQAFAPNAEHFAGLIDEVRIYNRALSANEMATLAAPILITNQPQHALCLPGSTGTFTFGLAGLSPLSYQWRFNGTNLPGQTNATLVISNVQPANVGLYSAVISNSLAVVVSSNAFLTIIIPGVDDDGDGLANVAEVQFGTNPLSPDTDSDALTDYEEIFTYHSNPLAANTSGDGIPDGWKVQYGLNPAVANANSEIGSSGVTYLQVYQYNLAHTNQLDPRNPFPASSPSLYEALNSGQITNKFQYDRNDRLRGMESSRGVSIGYTYDGNDNPVAQAVLSRESETNGLPVLWCYLNGLTNNTSAYADSDGDGWTDYQEWQAGSNPTNALSTPNLLGNPGTNIASLVLPFTPSNFVVGVGQLDGAGAEEIVIGGDGNPGTNVNFLLVLTQGSAGWSTQRVDVGTFGITSIAVGQVTNRPTPAIYAGLRGATNGSGRVMEFTSSGTNWQSNVVALSTNQAAFVLGARGQDVLASYAPSNGVDGRLYSLAFLSNTWTSTMVDTNTSHRGLGTVASLDGTNGTAFRITDNGFVQWVATGNGTNPNLPTNAVFRPESSAWYFLLPGTMSWASAEAQAQTYGGHLASINSQAENDWILATFVGGAITEPWIGFSDQVSEGVFVWSSGEPPVYTNWSPGEPNNSGGNQDFGFIYLYAGNGKWDDGHDIPHNGAFVKVQSPGLSGGSFAEPTVLNRMNWRGSSVSPGRLRQTNGASVIYSCIDDINANGLADRGDEFVFLEVQVTGTSNKVSTLARKTINGSPNNTAYGVVTANFTNGAAKIAFTAEPDGGVFSWIATGTNPLQRQLFSAHHTGKGWHALAGVKTLAPGEGLAGLRVDPATPNRCDVIFWEPQFSLPTIAGLPQTAPAAVVLPSTNALGSQAFLSLRLWDAEGNAATPFLQYQVSGGTNWLDATLTTLDGTTYSVTNKVATLPGGVNHTAVWNAQANLGANVVTNVLLRARASDFSLLGDWSAGTPFQVNMGLSQDSDGDGIPDAWELALFGNLTHNAATDSDGDGMSDFAEYIADTNPTNAASNLRIASAIPTPVGLILNWQGGIQATQVVQRIPGLSSNGWQNISTSLPPTPILNSYTNEPDTNGAGFYRIKAMR